MRARIKRLLVPGVSAVTRLKGRRGCRPGQRILTYHEIVPEGRPVTDPFNQVSEQRLRRHVEILRDAGIAPVGVGELMSALRRPREPSPDEREIVALTFDDGLEEHVSVALPLLREHSARGTFYVLCKGFGEPATAVGYPGRHLTMDGLAALLEAGMEIGSHGRTHRLGESETTGLAGDP